jgi:hypothetical protein
MARLLVLLIALALAPPLNAGQQAPPPGPSTDRRTLLQEPAALAFAMDFVGHFLGNETGGEKLGFYPVFGRVATGAGWISLGGGYRERVLGDRAIVDGSTAISWRAYKLAQTRFEFTDLANSRIAAGGQLVWKDLTQLNYFGPGPGSEQDGRSEYRLKTADFVGYLTYRPASWLAIGASGGWLDRPIVAAPTGPFDRHFPDARVVFPDDPAFALRRQPAFAHARASIVADTRNFVDRPTRGAVYAAMWTHYADQNSDAFSFDQYEVESARFVPLFREALVLAVHGWSVFSATATGQTVPVYLVPSLGGNNTLRSFPNYRFHDRNLLLASAEGRLALTAHLDVAAFVDSGSVAATAADLRLANNSYGVGLRLHNRRSTAIRLDAAHGGEGWRVAFNLSDPFRLRRLHEHAAGVPFVP